MSLLGLDIGTTGCKAVAFDREGNVLAWAYREYPLLHPQPGWSELDARGLWQKVVEVVREVNERLTTDPVEALSVSCQGEAVTAVDATGEPLCNFSVSFDHRTVPRVRWWKTRLETERLFQITGMPLHAMYTINKILWYKNNQPDVFCRAVKFLCVEDFINFKLTGQYATDWSLAARTMAFEVVHKRWSADVLRTADIDETLLPTPYPSGTPIGEVSPALQTELGFSRKVLVATGGHDQPCGALGSGITEPGMAMNATGTSDVVCPVFAEPILSRKMLSGNYACYPHVVPGQFVSVGFNLTGGLLLRWYRDTFWATEKIQAEQSGQDVYERIIAEATDDVQPLFFLPHFVGAGTPYLDSHSRGALVGLTVDTTRRDISKAVLDSINYEMKLNLERMNEAGLGIRELRAVGGGAKSRRWMQMKADTFGMPIVSLQVSEAAALGAAMLAGIAIGCFKDAVQAGMSMVHIKDTFHPNKKQTHRYQEQYDLYRQLYSTLKKFNHRMTKATVK